MVIYQPHVPTWMDGLISAPKVPTWMDGDISLCEAPGLEVGGAVHELVEGGVVLVELGGVLALVPTQLAVLEPATHLV